MPRLEKEYQDLLEKAEKLSDSFSLVWQDDFTFNQSAKDLEFRLAPYLILEERVSKWPGTELSEIKATLRKYEVTSDSIEILKIIGGVYNWQSPSYPEDLTFYIANDPWFISIAHEHDSWFTKT